MDRLHHQRCFNHALREAVARCPACRRYFCRECVVEHDDRLICAACQRKLTAPKKKKTPAWHVAARIAQSIAMLILLWMLFFACGRMLLALPDSAHQGTFWTPAEGGK